MKDTKQQFEHVIAICRDLFAKKLHDYGAAWRIMRPSSVTDQIFIKANRIRSIETKGVAMVDEGIRSEFIAIVNYGIIGLVQLELGYAETDDMTEERALELYKIKRTDSCRIQESIPSTLEKQLQCPNNWVHFNLTRVFYRIYTHYFA